MHFLLVSFAAVFSIVTQRSCGLRDDAKTAAREAMFLLVSITFVFKMQLEYLAPR